MSFIGCLERHWSSLDKVGWVTPSILWRKMHWNTLLADPWKCYCMFFSLQSSQYNYVVQVWLSSFFSPVAFKLYFWINHILTTVDKIGTPRFRRFVVDLLPWPTLHDLRDIIDTMHHASVEIIESKKQALKEGDGAFGKQLGQGKDIIGILSTSLEYLHGSLLIHHSS